MGKVEKWGRYWKAYGGSRALFSSRYAWLSLAMTLVLFPSWTQPGWWDTSISVISSMLGFTLAGFAILVGFGDERFRKLLSRSSNGEPAILLRTAAAFVHFIVVQMLALGLAVAVKFLYLPPPEFFMRITQVIGFDYARFVYFGNYVFWFLGVFLFVYACSCGIAATMWVFELCSGYVAVEQAEQAKQEKKRSEETHDAEAGGG